MRGIHFKTSRCIVCNKSKVRIKKIIQGNFGVCESDKCMEQIPQLKMKYDPYRSARERMTGKDLRRFSSDKFKDTL